MNQDISHLLNDQQHAVLEIRKICSNIVNLVMQTTAVQNKVRNKGQNKEKKVKKTSVKSAQHVMEVFLKISNLLLKVIPLEHQLYGVTLSKTLDNIRHMEDNNATSDITDEDLTILRTFYEQHLVAMNGISSLLADNFKNLTSSIKQK